MNQAKHWRESHAYPTEQQKHKKIVVKVRRRSWLTKGEKILYTFFSALLIIGCLYIVSYSSKLDSMNRDIQTLNQEVHNQQMENETLYFEVSELSSPDRILKIATEKGLKIQDVKVKRVNQINN